MDILVTEDLESPALDKLLAKYKVVRNPGLWNEPAHLLEQIAQARAVMIRNQTKMTAQVMAAAPQLQAIGRVGVGLDNIDTAAATERGVVVIAPLNANATSVAELTLGLILALARRIAYADRTTRAGAWDRRQCTGIEVDKKVLALCGFGRIGRMVAARARAFGMRIVVFDPFVKADSPHLGEIGASLATRLEEALELADFVSVHLPLTPETQRLFNGKAFAGMKRGAFFINTSRGGVMDESALIQALHSGHLGGAALDVRAVEPPGERSALESMDHVILTPHIGAFTREAQARTFEAVCDDLDRVLRGEPAVNYVNIPQAKK